MAKNANISISEARVKINPSNEDVNNTNFTNEKLIIKPEMKINYMCYIIDSIGFNRTTFLVFAYSAALNMVWGIEASFISINLPKLAKDFEFGDGIFTLFLTCLYMVNCIGAIIVGVGGTFGRMPRLLFSLLIYLSASIACSFSSNFYVVFGLRCLGNINIGLFASLSINILTEYLPTHKRCLYLMFASTFYNVGSFYLVILNFIFFEEGDDKIEIGRREFNNINNFSVIPGILALLMTFLVKESPHYLLEHRKYEKTFKLIKRMISDKIYYKFTEIERNNLLDYRKEVDLKHTIEGEFKELFNEKYWLLTTLNIVMSTICVLNMIASTFLVAPTLEKLKGKTIDFSDSTQLLIFGFIQFPNGFIGGYMTESDFFARKRTMWISAAACVFLYGFIIFYPYIFCIQMGFILFFNSLGFNVVYIYIAEAYSNKLRDKAQSLIQFISMFIGSFAPVLIHYFHNYSFEYNFIFFGFTYIICFIATIYLPFETKGMQLQDD